MDLLRITGNVGLDSQYFPGTTSFRAIVVLFSPDEQSAFRAGQFPYLAQKTAMLGILFIGSHDNRRQPLFTGGKRLAKTGDVSRLNIQDLTAFGSSSCDSNRPSHAFPLAFRMERAIALANVQSITRKARARSHRPSPRSPHREWELQNISY